MIYKSCKFKIVACKGKCFRLPLRRDISENVTSCHVTSRQSKPARQRDVRDIPPIGDVTRHASRMDRRRALPFFFLKAPSFSVSLSQGLQEEGGGYDH